jgi:hypothetical protein
MHLSRGSGKWKRCGGKRSLPDKFTAREFPLHESGVKQTSRVRFAAKVLDAQEAASPQHSAERLAFPQNSLKDFEAAPHSYRHSL